MFWFNRKKLSPKDLWDFQELNRLLRYERLKYFYIKNNTVMIKKGQLLAEQQFEVVGVIEKMVKEWVASILSEYGCEKGVQYNINLQSGVITQINDLPEQVKETLKNNPQLIK